MKLTIIPSDSYVVVDGDNSHRPLDLSTCGIPTDVHALQWNETAGWIEFVDNPDGTKPANEPITVLPQWADNCVAVWQAWTSPIPLAPLPTQSQPTTSGTQTV